MRPLYLKRMVIKNWRCFGDAEIDFMRGPRHRSHTILVGRNGSGKTSVLRAITLGLAQQREASALMGELAGDFVRRNNEGGVSRKRPRSSSNFTTLTHVV